MPSFMSEFIKEAYKHPIFSLLVALALGGWITFSFTHFAFASDVQLLKAEVRDISVSFERGRLESRVHNLESEIFSLERAVDDKTARDRDYQRLARLRSELGSAKRELQRLDN